MLLKNWKTQLITSIFVLAASTVTSAETQRGQMNAPSNSPSAQMKHYEYDYPDNLANPQDSTDIEIDEEEKDLEDLQKQNQNQRQNPRQNTRYTPSQNSR